MHNDLEIIVRQFPASIGQNLRIYAIGDVHVGAETFNESAIRKKLKHIQEDRAGCLVLVGDLGDFGLKNSKTNTYRATEQPAQQIEHIYELFKPVADKIVACVPGNHEERLVREVGICPLYDLCVRWGIEDVYRENLAIVKLIFGSKQKGRQFSFWGSVSHGSTRNKGRRFAMQIDGTDFHISGHTHESEYAPRGKIRVNPTGTIATHIPFKQLVVDANLRVGGYGLKKEYDIPAPPELQYLELGIKRDSSRKTSNATKTINYHAIQI